MIALKPAIATTACAGIRRMEAEQPPALGKRTFGGKGAEQWLLAMGCAKVEHPSRHWRQLQNNFGQISVKLRTNGTPQKQDKETHKERAALHDQHIHYARFVRC